jgi:dGTPase
MYRHARIARIMSDAEVVVRNLFEHYCASPEHMPPEWARGADAGDTDSRVRTIADFIAGMTDRYALNEHARLFKATPELR